MMGDKGLHRLDRDIDMGGYIPLIRSRLFAFKIFLGLEVGVT